MSGCSLFCCFRFVLVILLPEYLPVTTAADIYNRGVNTAEYSALSVCSKVLRGNLLLDFSWDG